MYIPVSFPTSFFPLYFFLCVLLSWEHFFGKGSSEYLDGLNSGSREENKATPLVNPRLAYPFFIHPSIQPTVTEDLLCSCCHSRGWKYRGPGVMELIGNKRVITHRTGKIIDLSAVIKSEGVLLQRDWSEKALGHLTGNEE